VLCLDGEVLGQREKMPRNKVVGVFDQFVLSDRIGDFHYCAGLDQCEHKSCYAFDDRVDTFEQNADLENLMNAAFIHGDQTLAISYTACVREAQKQPNCKELAAFSCVLA
jgi:hypothetical protein